MSHLFSLPSDSVKVTSDDAYTPAWVFDAMGLNFDLDVASPPGGPWHVPCDRYYTAEDDGLAQPWDGLVWCNPPYSTAEQWIARWAAHDAGCLMTQVASRQRWRSTLYAAADAVYVGQVAFTRPDGSTLKFGWTPICVAFRGVGVEPAERLAAADPYGAVLYGKAAIADRLAESRESIASAIEDAALMVMSDPETDPDGAPLVSAVLRRASTIAREVSHE